MLVELIKSVGKRQFPLDLTDPQPLQKFEGMWRVASQVAIIGFFFMPLIAAIEYARPILLPIVSAFMLGMMLGPLSNLAARIAHPDLAVSAIVLWLLVIALFYGLICCLSAPLVDWVGQGARARADASEKNCASSIGRSPRMQDMRNALFPKSGDEEVAFSFVSMLQPAVTVVTPAIGQMVIFFGTLFFFLLGRAQLRQVLVVFFKNREAQAAHAAHSQ